ncbi:MAG: hypothetical protein Q8N51_02355, partial [Gammaproteobacteria bacterium]|nr:hypothetical protein [Gammaproteobacteria bacterium]
IIQRITMDGGARMIKEYISDMTRVIHEWFREHGFSIGIDDVTMPAWAHRDAHRTLASAEIALTRAEWLRDAQEGTISEVDTARLEIAAFAGMSAALERASDVERAQRESTPWTRERALDDMIRSGSKGKNENRESLKVGLGVTIVGAARVGRDARGKTIPGFLRYEPSPAAQGFVRGNYMDGINPMEYYFHAMAGRRGLADTAVKTSETGYMQKRGTKVMEDKVARCDGSVRGRMGIVVQACYGGDGMDPMKIELVELPALAMGDSELCAQAGGSAEYQSVLLELRDAVRCIRFSPSLPAIESRVQLPIHAWNSGWCCSCPKPIELFLRNSIFPPSSSLSNEEGHAGAGAGSGAAGDDADTCCCSCSEVLLKFYSWMVRRHGVK